jgi:hypothetical protein
MLRRATFALCHNQFRHKPNPPAITRKAKGITLLKFLSLHDCTPELRKKRCFAIAPFYIRQRASYRCVIATIFDGWLAGGTTPFIRRYSTICP